MYVQYKSKYRSLYLCKFAHATKTPEKNKNVYFLSLSLYKTHKMNGQIYEYNIHFTIYIPNKHTAHVQRILLISNLLNLTKRNVGKKIFRNISQFNGRK